MGKRQKQPLDLELTDDIRDTQFQCVLVKAHQWVLRENTDMELLTV